MWQEIAYLIMCLFSLDIENDFVFGFEFMQMSELNKTISQMRTILYGSGEAEPSPDACAQLTLEFFKENTFRLFMACIPRLNSGVNELAFAII